MDGIIRGSKVKEIFYVPGKHITAVDDRQKGIHRLAIVDATLEGSK